MKSLIRPTMLGAGLAIILFFALTLLIATVLPSARIDLTEDRLYSISDGTKTVVEWLDQPISLVYFFSESVARDYPQYFAHGRRVRDLLKEYAALSDGRISLEIVEPEAFSEEEDRAVAAGMQAAPTASGESIYMGLIARDLTDREALIPFFSIERDDFLEYDLTKLVAEVAGTEKPHVGLLTALPMAPTEFGGLGRQARPGWAIYQQLEQLFELTHIAPDFAALPEDADLLLIIHPPALAPEQLYQIDQYLMRGGRAVVFLDPQPEAALAALGATGAMPPGAVASDLGPLLGSWGLQMPEGRIVADFDFAQRVNMGGSGVQAVKDYILWLAVRQAGITGMDPVTANLEQINLASSGVLLPIEGSGVTIEPLLRSSAVSTLVEAERARGMPDPDTLLRDTAADDKIYDLVVRVSGVISSAFPDGPPVDDSGAEDQLPAAEHLARSNAPVNLIVGADSDLFDDRFWVQTREFFGERVLAPVADNGTLLINAIDQLSGSDALISLRGRGVKARPFEVVNRIRRSAEARYRAEEERLQAELATTERRLADLQSGAQSNDVLFSPEQDAEIRRFQGRALEIRRELRAVQRGLVEDITALGNRLAFINIALVPAILVVIALALAALKRRQGRRRPV